MEWKYIRQHIPEDPLWSSAEVAKETTAGETAARLGLFDAVVQLIVDLNHRGSTDYTPQLSVTSDRGFSPIERFEVTTHYLFTLCERAVASALQISQRLYSREDFRMDVPDMLSLAGIPAIRSKVPRERDYAVELFLEAQDNVDDLPAEANEAAAAYRTAVAATGDFNQHLERLQLTPFFPSESVCDLCQRA